MPADYIEVVRIGSSAIIVAGYCRGGTRMVSLRIKGEVAFAGKDDAIRIIRALLNALGRECGQQLKHEKPAVSEKRAELKSPNGKPVKVA
ncbi:MAG: hypothetical protein QXY39_01805 [Thermofilaceae archaeon]